MADPKLAAYIEEARKKGYHDIHIADRLRKAGYTEAHIESSLKSGSSAAPAPEKPAKRNVSPSKNKSLILIVSVVVVILIIALLVGKSLFPGDSETPLVGSTSPEFLPDENIPGDYLPDTYTGFEIVNGSLCSNIPTLPEFELCLDTIPKTKISVVQDCEAMQNQEVRLLCIAIISGVREDCVPTSNVEYCYSLQARNRRDASGCLIIENEIIRNNCLINCNQTRSISMYNEFLFLFID